MLEKFELVRSILESHNALLNEGEEKINVDSVLKQIRKNGGTSDQRLARIRFEDLENWGTPSLLAREVAEVFRGPETTKPEKVIILDDDPVKLANKLKPSELVEKYDPENSDDAFGEKLKILSGGQRFIVFNNDGTVNVSVSQNLLQELRDNYPERQSVIVESDVHKTYRVGDCPSKYADEHPVWHGKMLRPNGMSDADIDWKSVPLNVRQLIYLAIKTGELKGKDEQDIRDLVDNKTFNELGKRWKNASLKFKELSETNQLPQLKIKLGVGSDKQNPFMVGNRVW
jgi:hypothetical protein